jgi:hypothetical protein
MGPDRFKKLYLIFGRHRKLRSQGSRQGFSKNEQLTACMKARFCHHIGGQKPKTGARPRVKPHSLDYASATCLAVRLWRLDPAARAGGGSPMRVCEMRVGGEGWDFDVEVRLASEPPSNFAQAGGPAINERRDRPELGVDYVILPRISSV